MAFVFSKTTPATGTVAVYNFKELLKTAGWTIQSSSDATTYNASGDQISSGSSGAGGLGNTNAWFRIQSPDGIREFTFQRGSSSIAWRIKYSFAAKFTGGSPGAAQTPSAADEFLVTGSGSDASPGFNNIFSTDNTYRWNVGADNAAPYGFWSCAFPSGGGASGSAIILDPLTGTAPTDAHTHLLILTSNNVPLTFANLASETKSVNNRGLSTIPSATPTTVVDYSANGFYTAVGQTVPDNTATNPLNSKDETFPIVWARRTALVNPGYKGTSTILKWNGTARTTGDTMTISTSRDRIIYGQCNLPWDGTVPSV